MNSKKVLAALVSALMVLTMFAGCGSGDSGSATDEEKITATITVWGPQEDQSEENGKWLQTECEAFAAEHENWDLTFEYGVCSEGDAGNTVSSDPAAAGDVYMFANDQIGKLLSANAISELGGSTVEQIQSQNSASVVNLVTYEGGIYGVPFTGNTWFMYYDNRVYSEDDIKSLDTMMSKGTVAFPLSNGWYISAFFVADGATFFGADGSDEEAGIQLGENATDVTNYLIDAVNSGKLVNDTDGYGLSNLGGAVSAFFSGSWDYQNAVNQIGEENLGIAALPTITINGEELQMKSFAGAKAIAVNPNCEYPEVAVALAAYLGSTKAQQDHYDLRSIIPTDTSIDISQDALATAQADTMNRTSIMQPAWAGMSNWWTPAQTFGENIVNKVITHDNAQEMTEKFQEQVNTSTVQ